MVQLRPPDPHTVQEGDDGRGAAGELALSVVAALLIGMDRVKGEDVLVPAYDDAAGVTAVGAPTKEQPFDSLRIGTKFVDSLYLGNTKVWP